MSCKVPNAKPGGSPGFSAKAWGSSQAKRSWIWGAFVVNEVEPLDKLMDEMQRVLRLQGRAAIMEWQHEDAYLVTARLVNKGSDCSRII